MEYEANKHYPFSELPSIAQWWQTHREYDINEIREPREYIKKPITETVVETDEETGEEISKEVVVGEEEFLVEREYDDYVEIVRRSDEQIVSDLRAQREYECFPYVNRGNLWYDTLTDEQKAEFKIWYSAWLNCPETLIAPQKPVWLK